MSLVLRPPPVVLAVKVSNVTNNFSMAVCRALMGRSQNLDLVTELLMLLVGIVRVFLANILCRLCTLSLERPLIPLSCCCWHQSALSLAPDGGFKVSFGLPQLAIHGVTLVFSEALEGLFLGPGLSKVSGSNEE